MQSWDMITADVARNWPIYASMPFIAALIGYVTKLVAIRMMFRPFAFKGIGPLGWQGIIPRRAPQMVDVLCETLTGRLISADEIIARVDADELGAIIARQLREEVARIVPKVAEAYQPVLWELLPVSLRAVVVQRAQAIALDKVPDLVAAIRDNIDDVFDLRELATREFLSDPYVLESMFLDVGKREFAFIRRSGLVFGFGIGLLQAVCWALFKNPWIMPVFGLFTGWFTDWAALRLIFNPKEPKKYLGVITWHGLFLKHRIPVSQEYGNLIAEKVLTTDRLVKALFTGSKSEKLVDVVAELVEKAIVDQVPDMDQVLRTGKGLGGILGSAGIGLDRIGVGTLSVGSVIGAVTGAVEEVVGKPIKTVVTGLDVAQVKPMSRAAATDLVAAFPAIVTDAEPYLDRALDIRNTMVEKMVAMTPLEFEGVLRPAFQQDERTLIMVGAILGFLVGELQVFLVEHLSH